MSGIEEILSRAKKALELNQPEEALAILDQASAEKSAEVLYLKGEIYYKLQQWGEALNQFSSFLEQFPCDRKAESYCEMIRDILGFYHKDLNNP